VFSEPRPGEFAVNPAAALLRADHPAGMRNWLDLDGFGGRMDLAFTSLVHTVRTGEPAWARVFGQPFWQCLDANPEISAAFDQTMAAGASYWAAIADGFDWPATAHVVDVGGGTGALLGALLARNPGLRGTLLDSQRPWHVSARSSMTGTMPPPRRSCAVARRRRASMAGC
jgi:hypothetical protein